MQTIRRKRISILGIAVVSAFAVVVAVSLLHIPSAAAQSPTTLTLTAPGATVSEDAGAVTVTATLDQPAPAGGVRVTLKSTRPIAGRARAGLDFTLPAAFTITEGQTSGTADITILDDNSVGPDKLIVLNATVNVQGITVKGVTLTLSDDDYPILTGLRVYHGSDLGEDSDFGRLPQLLMTPRFDGLTYEYEAQANPDIEDVTVFVTGGVDRGVMKIGPQGSLEDVNVIAYGNGLSQPITLADGENIIEVQWTRYGRTTTYTVEVTRGLLAAPAVSVTRGARYGGPIITIKLTDTPSVNQDMRVQVRESTTDDWPDPAVSNTLPSGASATSFTRTFKTITISGLAKGTDYEVRAHLLELSGPLTERTRAVSSRSSDEVQVTTLSPAPAPTGLILTATQPGTGVHRAIRVSWDAVEDGSPTMWYQVRWRKADQTPEAEWSRPLQTSTTGYSVSIPADGTFDVQVASDNGINPIAWSEVKQAKVDHAGGM